MQLTRYFSSSVLGQSKAAAIVPTPQTDKYLPLVSLVKPESLLGKNASLEERIQQMEGLVKEAHQLFEEEAEESGKKRERLFVAPEYFFDKQTNSKRQIKHAPLKTDRQLDESEKKQVVDAMKALSKKYPDITIMPGTINCCISIRNL